MAIGTVGKYSSELGLATSGLKTLNFVEFTRLWQFVRALAAAPARLAAAAGKR